MRIREKRLRQLIREVATGVVGDPPGRVDPDEFIAKVKEIAREFPDMKPQEVVDDALSHFSELDGMGGGVDEGTLEWALEEAEELLGLAALEVEIDRRSEAKTSPSALDQFRVHNKDTWYQDEDDPRVRKALESMIARAAAGLGGVTSAGTETWNSPDGETSETYMTFKGPRWKLEELPSVLRAGLDPKISRFLKFKFADKFAEE